MRSRSIASVVVLVAVGIAMLASGAGSARTIAPNAHAASKTVTKKIALPPVNGVKVSELSVRITAPRGKRVGKLKLIARNAKELGSPQGNTQVVAVVSPKSSAKRQATFKVWIFIHRFPPVSRSATAAEESSVDVVAEAPGHAQKASVFGFVNDLSCDELADRKGPGGRHFNFLGDGWQDTALGNLIPGFATAVEEQIDNDIFRKPCPGAEAPDTGD